MSLCDRVVAEMEIQRLTAAYSHAVMRRDASAAAQTYIEDGVLTAFYAPDIIGRSAIAAVLASALQPLQFICQTASAGVIDVNDGTARATWTITEFYKFKEGDELGCCFGMYEDTLSRCSEGWRFMQRRFTPFYRGTIPSKGKTYRMPEFGIDVALELLFTSD